MKNLREPFVLLALLAVLFLKLDPFHWFMPTSAQMIILALFAAAFSLYAGTIASERPRDERESNHLTLASRMGYFVGIATLSAVIVVQDLAHRLDAWPCIVLGAMIIAKFAVLAWARRNR